MLTAFSFGAATILAAEFLLAHWFLYRDKKKAAATVPQVIKGFVRTAESELIRTEKFFGDLFSAPANNSVTPVPAANTSSTAANPG